MKQKHQIHRSLAKRSSQWLGLCTITFCAFAAGQAMAQSTWTGDTDALWSTDANWSGTPPDSATSGDLIFDPTALTGSLILSTSNDLTNFTATGIAFDNQITAGEFTLADGSITLGGDITTTGAEGTPTHSISLGMILNGDRTITTDINNNLAISGGISNDATIRNLSKQGDGTLTLTGNNSYGGTTTVGLADLGGGVLTLGHNNALGGNGALGVTGTGSSIQLQDGITINNALTVSDDGDIKTLALETGATAAEYSGTVTNNETTAGNFAVSVVSPGALTLSNTVSGNQLSKTADGTLILSGDNNYTGGTNIAAGTVRASHNNALGTAGTVSLNGTGAILELANNVNISPALTISDTGAKKTIALQAGATSAEYSGNITSSEDDNASNFEASVGSSGTLTFSGVVSGSGVVNTGYLTKTEDGTLVLSGTADNITTRSLFVNVTAGELHLGKTSSSTVHAVYGISGIADGATVKLTGTGGDQIYDANSNSLNGIHGMVDSGTFDLNGNSETLTYLEGSGGIVTNSSGNPATLTIGAKSVSFGFGGAIQNGSGTLALSKITSGVVTLSGENTYTGATTVTGGVLRLDHPNALPGGTGTTGGTSFLTVNGGVIGLGASDFTRGLGTGVDQVQFNGNTNGFAAFGADRIVNLGGASDTINFNGTNFFTASNATLVFGHSTATHTVNFQNPLILGATNAKTFRADDGAADIDGILSGAITGDGGVTKAGAGTLAITGAAAYSGITKVDAGTLTLSNAAAPENANPNNDASTVTIAATGATLDLTYAGTDVVTSLVIGTDPPLADGVYGKEGSTLPIIGIPQITGDGTLTVGIPVSDPYEDWAGPGVEFDADANDDGVENGLAWLLGAGGPNDNATGLLPKSEKVTGGLKLTFKKLPEGERDGAELYLEYSTDLGTWSTGEIVPDVDELDAPVTFVISGTDPLDVEATISDSEAAAGKLFGRLRAER